MDVFTVISVMSSTLGVGAFISGVISRKLTKAENEAEKREQARTEEMILLLTGVKSTGALSYATAVAMKRGHANGEVEKGVEDYEAWKKDLDSFLIRQSAKK